MKAKDIQKNEKRAEYGGQLMEQLSTVLMHDYGRGYSVKNLWDMKRFFGCFEILQTPAGQLQGREIVQPLAGQSQPKRICQPLANKLSRNENLQPVVADPAA